jgi:hypothetical protein
LGAVLVGVLSATVSCGPDSKSKSTGPVALGAFSSGYADAWCRGLKPCCGASGFPFDLDQCKQSVGSVLDSFVKSTSTLPNRVFDEMVAGACVEAQGQRLASCNDRDAFNGGDACDGLFRGTVALGGSCAENQECAPATGGVRCNAGVCEPYQDPLDRPAPTRNPLGATCNSTCSADPFLSYCEYPDVPEPLAGCYADDGLFCSNETQVCEPLPRVGEACPQAHCEKDTYCSLGKCVAAVTSGPCDSRDQCAHTSKCNIDTLTCEPRKANGESCNDLDDCLSASCVGDVCRDWSVATPARCAGGLDG